MVIARNDESHLKLKEQFHNRTVVKKYAAIVVEASLSKVYVMVQIGKPRDNITDKSPVNIINQPLARHPKNINKMVVSRKVLYICKNSIFLKQMGKKQLQNMWFLKRGKGKKMKSIHCSIFASEQEGN